LNKRRVIAMSDIKPITFLLLKLANSCNINCSYCYWFKDVTVYEGSNLISDTVITSFNEKLKNHILNYAIKEFTVSLHGGEPLLAGKKKFETIVAKLRSLEIELAFKLNIYLQTNAILIDEEWIDLFVKYNIHIGISLDGNKTINDVNRLDFRGKSTHQIIEANIRKIQKRNLQFGILAVCNPNFEPEDVCEYFINELNVKSFDILIPDANFTYETIPQIQNYYSKLFQIWYEKYYYIGVKIRIASSILHGLLGKNSKMQAIGHNSVNICMIKPDGEIEPLDFLHVLGNGTIKNKLNIASDEINDITKDKFWLEIYNKSLNLHTDCLECKFGFACGGGHIASRWSLENRFDNPSVYCQQLYGIFENSLSVIRKSISHAK
jgi:uncharacterized protein